MKRKEIHLKLSFFLSCLIAFFLPVYNYFVPTLIVISVINWFFEGNFADKLKRLKSNFFVKLFTLFYLLYIVGLLWTENINVGLLDILLKLSIFIFPVIYASFEGFYNEKKYSAIFSSFVLGCLITTIYCLAHAYYLWHLTGENYFMYSRLSMFMHPSYFAMYLTLAMSILLYKIYSRPSFSRIDIFNLLLIFWFWFFIIQLQSKAGIIISALVFVIFAVLFIISKRKYLQVIITLFLLFGGYYLSNRFLITSGNSRMFNAEYNIVKAKIDTTTAESNQVRILIWKASWDIFKENYLYGVGTGDIKSELDKMYLKRNMIGAHENHLNAHNQYIQSALGFGILGLALLILVFLLPFIYSVAEKKYLYALFLIIIGLNFCIESMLETQAGVMFFAFFNTLFFLELKRK